MKNQRSLIRLLFLSSILLVTSAAWAGWTDLNVPDANLLTLTFELDPSGVCVNGNLNPDVRYSFFRVSPAGVRLA